MRTTITRYRGYKIITTDIYRMFDVRRPDGDYIGFGETIAEAIDVILDDIRAMRIQPAVMNKIKELNEFRLFLEKKYFTERDNRYKGDYDACDHDLLMEIELAARWADCDTLAVWRIINNERNRRTDEP